MGAVRPFRGYGFALLAALGAALLRWMLHPFLEQNFPLVTFFGAAYLVAWRHGLGPTLVAVGVGALLAEVLFLDPVTASAEGWLVSLLGLGLFLATGIVAGVMGEHRLRAQARAEIHAAEASRSQLLAEDTAAQAEEEAARAEEEAERAEEAAAKATEAMEALRGTRDHLRAILDASPLGMACVDREARVRAWNPAAERIFGWSAAEVLGRSLPTVGPQHEAEFRSIFQRLLDGEPLGDYETVRRRKDGKEIHVAVSTGVLSDERGLPSGVVFVYQDITARKQMETELRQSQKMEAMGQLSGGVAHDFNNILTAIACYNGLLLDEPALDSAARTHLHGIQEATERAAALTQQLLAFSRKQVLQPTVINPRDFITDTGRLLRRLIGEHIDLAMVTGPLLSPVLADRGQLSQVLINLVLNARDAMPHGGRLTIEARDMPLSEEYAGTHLAIEPGGYVCIAVSDTGVGMTPEVQARIFEPFFTTKPRGQGTGLGLSTVFGIIKQLGGHMFVYSEPGQGSTFKIYLPRVDASAETPVTTRPAPVRPGTETILIVEDDPAIRVVIEGVLRAKGYTVLAAGRPSEATQLAGEPGDIHLLLSDVVLPEMTGRDLSEQLVAARPGLKVLFMSGYTDSAIEHQGRLEPDTEFLQKPFTPDLLLRRVREVLDAGGGAADAGGAEPRLVHA